MLRYYKPSILLPYRQTKGSRDFFITAKNNILLQHGPFLRRYH